MRPVALVLAAGKGERLGGPKALLAWPAAPKAPPGAPGERPLAIAHAEARLAAESERVLVVVRKPVFNVLLRFVRPGIDLLVSNAPDELGPAGSLAFAASRLGDAAEVVVTPVDAPPPRADTVALLLARLRAGDPPPLAVRPRHERRGGHPVVMRAEALARYREASPPPLRDHLRALGARSVDEDVDDPGVLLDLDTPVDVIRATGAPPRFIG
jgi:CTP:molybdopterin cytidylyltransferase MocA